MKSTILIAVLALTACGGKSTAAPATRIAIDVTERGFTPEKVEVPQGKPVTLVFDRKTDATCAKSVVLEVAGKKIERDLPLNQPVEVAVTFPKAGELTYACGMDMAHGIILVR
ncbi:MAG TPA: cupredoxin domain-containing protein [Kofleriaceae bacterium]|nr:cupredoxin domain-containing protein [Kofleriaceae bacterium]